MSDTKIEWADKVWNPVTGCTPISEGCANCYARRMANRLQGRFGYDAHEPFKPTFHADKLDEPSRWTKPQRVFVCSMGDAFHDAVVWPWFVAMMETVERYPKHTFMFLTKRPHNAFHRFQDYGSVPSNIWLGVTAENQRQADKRIPVLLRIPAVVRFVSCEPLLEPIILPGKNLLHWVIAGPETGPGRRLCKSGWILDLALQCGCAGISFFDKRENFIRREFPKEP